jgi:hypothetical protein
MTMQKGGIPVGDHTVTSSQLQRLTTDLEEYGIFLDDWWMTAADEEGVYLISVRCSVDMDVAREQVWNSVRSE